MRAYRCYFLDHAGGIEKAEIVESDSDEGALLAAVNLLDRQSACAAIEVWRGARKVFPKALDGVDVGQAKRLLLGAGVMVAE